MVEKMCLLVFMSGGGIMKGKSAGGMVYFTGQRITLRQNKSTFPKKKDTNCTLVKYFLIALSLSTV